MIEAVQLCKTFRRNQKSEMGKRSGSEEFYAVDHVSLQANKGEILGILGPNGAGKTTLLRMLGRIMNPSAGEVFLFDENGNKYSDVIDMKKQIGYLSGNTKLYHRFSIREILIMAGEVYGLSREKIEERSKQIISVLDMEKFADNRMEKLSTGQTQRANIARCLIHDPLVYIFDEPTLGLDIISSESILSFMKKEREQGKTILYSTHYMEEAQYLCDRILMMYEGKIIAQGTSRELMEQTGTDNLRSTFQELIRKGKEEQV
ncbi:MAG: ABC transporter ATP-binding protein [Lachnospiraceae bacterium]